jgi:thioesterase domain-containing protein
MVTRYGMWLPLMHVMDCIAAMPKPLLPRITVVGYSRGAYSAIRVAQALGKQRIPVYALLLLDTVKVTVADTEATIAQVIDRYDNSFDIEAGGPPRERPDRRAHSSVQSGRTGRLRRLQRHPKRRSRAVTGAVWRMKSMWQTRATHAAAQATTSTILAISWSRAMSSIA